MTVIIPVLNILFLAAISFWMWRREKSSLRKFFLPALLLKVIAGVCLGLVYTYYYSIGDTFIYFEDATRLAKLAQTSFGSYIKLLWSSDDSLPVWADLMYKQPRALFFSKITSVFCILANNNYWTVSCYFSVISFLAAWHLVKKIVDISPQAGLPAVASFLFFPSVVFWSAGIIKESIAMAALYILSTIFLKCWRREKLQLTDWVFAALTLWVLWNVKYYYLAIFLPVAATTLVMQFILSRVTIVNLFVKVALWCGIFIIPVVVVSTLHPNFYPDRFMGVVVSSYEEFQSISDAEDLIHYHSLEPTPLSIAMNIPFALFSGLFRPFIIEVRTLFQLMIALENLLLLLFFGSALTQVRKLIHTKKGMLLISVLIYSFLLCVFLALSTPNFGTLSRYRIGFLPFLLFVLTLENPLFNKIVSLKIFRRVVP